MGVPDLCLVGILRDGLALQDSGGANGLFVVAQGAAALGRDVDVLVAYTLGTNIVLQSVHVDDRAVA